MPNVSDRHSVSYFDFYINIIIKSTTEIKYFQMSKKIQKLPADLAVNGIRFNKIAT